MWNVRRVLGRIADSPTGDLLTAAGSGDLTDATAWEARRSQASHAAREREATARRDDLAKHDTWLSARLSGGPVLLTTVERDAAEAGLTIRSPRGSGASLHGAAARLRIAGGVQERDGPVWRALPNRWDRDQFTPIRQGVRDWLDCANGVISVSESEVNRGVWVLGLQSLATPRNSKDCSPNAHLLRHVHAIYTLANECPVEGAW